MIDKISSLINQKTIEQNTIYVLKGFNSIMDKLKLDCAHILDLHLIQDINNLENPQNKLLENAIKGLASNAPLYCLYEEMYMFIKLNLFGIINANKYKVCVIDIGIFNNYYPGFINQNNDNIVNKYDQDSSESNFLQKVYSGCVNENGNLVISYNEIDPEFVDSYISLFMSHSTYLIPHKKDHIKNIDVFDNTNSQHLVGIFNKISKGECNTISYFKVENNDKSPVLKFVSVLNFLGVSVITKETLLKVDLPDLYEEYLEVLHRKNKTYNFYDIEMYKDPFNTNEIFKLNQSIIIDTIYKNILKAQDGEYPRDIFVTAPTGAGKSILFQIPAILAAERNNLVTIVISPLIGLMNDQVENIKSMTRCAATINSDFTPFEKEKIKEDIKNGKISILYISPESLLSNTDITTFIGGRQIGLLVIDEAHTVATWGKNFRPDYWYLGDYLNKLRHNSKHLFPIATFTATATIGNGTEDMYHDIIDSLNMSPIEFIGNVKRKNIKFDIRVCKKDHAYAEEKDRKVISTINKYLKCNEKTLVYFPYVSKLNEIYNYLDTKKISKYYGGLDKTNKNETLDNIKVGTSNVVLATKAFGMGIDVPDIINVYHFAPTGNLADYVQEIGRAARIPTLMGTASTDFYREDFRYINKLYGMSQITVYNIIGVLQKILYKYRRCKKRNFLISTEEFAHVFVAQDDAEIENKLKATILAIKKDFIKMSNYVPLIFKPRSMFTKGLFFIPDSKLDYVKSIGFYKYLNKKYDREELSKMTGKGISYSYLGDVYYFDFKKCWEEKYNNFGVNGLSFGAFKRKFFTVNDSGFNELGIDKGAFLDRMLLKVETKYGEDFNSVCNKSYLILDKIKETLDDIKISGKHFSIEEMAVKVCKKLNQGISARKMRGILDPLLNILISVDRNTTFGKTKFCEYNSQTDKYHVISSYYNRMIYDLKKEIKAYFCNNLLDKERISIIDSTKDANKKMRKNLLLVAVQILELFDLVTYSLQNGERPEFFIRINSEKAIQKVLDKKDYHSQTLDTVRDMHYSSVDFMTYFFEKLSDNESRWNFIEDYFLGVNLYEKYNIEKNNKTKIKKLDDDHKKQEFYKNVDVTKKETINIYKISGDEVEGRYYISNKEIQLTYPAIKLSKDCEVAKCLLKSKVGDVFKVNEYEYLIENIEKHEI